MTNEQKAAYINAQVACAMIEALGMQAENAHRLATTGGISYGEEAFAKLADKYGIHHNACVSFFHNYT